MSNQHINLAASNSSRRLFLKASVTAGGGFLLLGSFPTMGQERGLVESPPQPNVFIAINPDNTITIKIKHLDMGQGTVTGLASIVAEELDADWEKVMYEYAPADVNKFRNGLIGVQGTGVSTSIANSWIELRKAGAAARQMLIQAAALHWSVPLEEISTDNSHIHHKIGGKSMPFGFIAKQAAEIQVPQTVAFKSRDAYRLIGQNSIKKLDNLKSGNFLPLFYCHMVSYCRFFSHKPTLSFFLLNNYN
jgi:isoquinoline 1-oxidoreductase beta subunit